MVRLLLKLFLWWWPKVPTAVRYSIAGAFFLAAAITFFVSPIPVPVVLCIVGAILFLYGDPSPSEKRGYHF